MSFPHAKIALLALLLAGTALPTHGQEAAMSVADFDTLWNYGDPAGTEAKFRALLPDAERADADLHAQLLSQIARCEGLQRNFEEARRLLDEAERVSGGEAGTAAVRILLERGRTYNSDGDTATAIPYFESALRQAQALDLDFHAVDAAHMLGIASPGDEGLAWNLKAIEMAQASEDPRARGWLGSLLNNTGWSYHEAGEYEKALQLFHQALDFRREQGRQQGIRIAEWCVARCLRSLGRLDEAMTMQRDLERQYAETEDEDGYVSEEIGELLLAQGEVEAARPYFAKAYAVLSQDVWLQANEEARLERLAELGGVK
jgi:tetratricopeptide (TPR) repeat protein